MLQGIDTLHAIYQSQLRAVSFDYVNSFHMKSIMNQYAKFTLLWLQLSVLLSFVVPTRTLFVAHAPHESILSTSLVKELFMDTNFQKLTFMNGIKFNVVGLHPVLDNGGYFCGISLNVFKEMICF
jgi:hypothetical protein